MVSVFGYSYAAIHPELFSTTIPIIISTTTPISFYWLLLHIFQLAGLMEGDGRIFTEVLRCPRSLTTSLHRNVLTMLTVLLLPVLDLDKNVVIEEFHALRVKFAVNPPSPLFARF